MRSLYRSQRLSGSFSFVFVQRSIVFFTYIVNMRMLP
jgi:hypothetical protein